jgi:hypothetical protein
VLHEVPVPSAWLTHLHTFPAARLIISSEANATALPFPTSALLLSRLKAASAAGVAKDLTDIPATELTRLPLERAVLQVGSNVATVEMEEGGAALRQLDPSPNLQSPISDLPHRHR